MNNLATASTYCPEKNPDGSCIMVVTDPPTPDSLFVENAGMSQILIVVGIVVVIAGCIVAFFIQKRLSNKKKGKK